jgi:hypothetical protein
MNIEEFNNSVNNFLGNLKSDMTVINTGLTVSALSLIHSRITNEGLSGKKYSTNPLRSYYFTGKSISQTGEDKTNEKIKKNRKAGINGISYVDFRTAQGLQTNHVDLRLSGDMWRDIGFTDSGFTDKAVSTTGSGLKYTSSAGFRGTITYENGKTTSEIADYNAERYGDFLTPTKAEENILDNALDEELQNLINTYFK